MLTNILETSQECIANKYRARKRKTFKVINQREKETK
jgi:hypothetical protein